MEIPAAELQLDLYLGKLGLNDLRVAHWQQQLESSAGPLRLPYARKLADVYAALMLQLGDEAQRQAYLSQLEELRRRFPEVDSPTLQVVTLQSDFQRAESLVQQWGVTADPQLVAQAGELLARIAPVLLEREREFATRVQELEEKLTKLEERPVAKRAKQAAIQRVETELAEAQAVAVRARFLAAWTHYYWGVLERNIPRLAEARRLFRQLLDMDGEGELTADWLELESAPRARLAVGLGMTELAAGNRAEGAKLFALLAGPTVAAEVRENHALWELRGLLNAGNYEAAAELAGGVIKELGPPAGRPQMAFAVLLCQAGFQGQAGRAVGRLGLQALVQLREYRVLQQVVEKYDVPLGEEDSFLSAWLKGRAAVAAADQSKQPKDYRDAIALLDAALKSGGDAAAPHATGKCLSELAWCHLQLKAYREAAEAYRRAAQIFAGLADADAGAKAAWLRFVALFKLGEDRGEGPALALAALNELQRDFPGTEYAERAEGTRGKLERMKLDPGELIRRLESTPRSSPEFGESRYELCLVTHQQWTAASQGERGPHSRRVQTYGQQYLELTQRDPDKELGCLLLIVDVLLAELPGADEPPPDPAFTRIDELMRRAAKVIGDLPAGHPALAEYHFRSLQVARARGDSAQADLQAQRILDAFPNSSFALPALVARAKLLEDRLASSSASDPPPELLKDLRAVYGQLVRRLGDAPQVLKANRNAQVALAESAHYAALLGDQEEALAAAEKLLAVFPKERRYLKQAAAACVALQRWKEALPHWRTLLAGLPQSDTAWFEAKYYQLACLAKLDRDQARRVARQFLVLYPEGGQEPWRDRLKTLATQLQADR